MGARENTVSLPEDLPAPIPALAAEVAGRGGRAYLVGGFVRDLLLGSPSKDLDVEVFGLSVEELEEILAPHGEVIRIGKAFGVLRVKGLDVDFSVPRRDSKVGSGHRGFLAHPDPDMSPADAVRRRDLTINALLLDPLSGAVTDPTGFYQFTDLGPGIYTVTENLDFLPEFWMPTSPMDGETTLALRTVDDLDTRIDFGNADTTRPNADSDGE